MNILPITQKIRPFLAKPFSLLKPKRTVQISVLTGFARGCRFEFPPPFKTQRWLGTDELEVAFAFASWLPKVECFVDIGANDGFYTTVAAAKYGVRRVIAYEPTESMMRLSQRNLHLNGLSIPDNVAWNTGFIGSSGVALSACLNSLPEPLLLKIDVDGAELDILQSGEAILGSMPKVHIILETHSRSLEENCDKLLQEAGFSTKIIKNAWWRVLLPEQRPSGQCRWLIASKDPLPI